MANNETEAIELLREIAADSAPQDEDAEPIINLFVLAQREFSGETWYGSSETLLRDDWRLFLECIWNNPIERAEAIETLRPF